MSMDWEVSRRAAVERALAGVDTPFEARETSDGSVLVYQRAARVALAFVPHGDANGPYSLLYFGRDGAPEHYCTGSFADLVFELLTYGIMMPGRRVPEGVDVAALAQRVLANA